MSNEDLVNVLHAIAWLCAIAAVLIVVGGLRPGRKRGTIRPPEPPRHAEPPTPPNPRDRQR